MYPSLNLPCYLGFLTLGFIIIIFYLTVNICTLMNTYHVCFLGLGYITQEGFLFLYFHTFVCKSHNVIIIILKSEQLSIVYRYCNVS